MQVEIPSGRLLELLRELAYGGKEANDAKAQAAMKKCGAERTKRFKEKVAAWREMDKRFDGMRSALSGAFGDEDELLKSYRGVREIVQKLAKRKVAYPIVPKERPVVFTGSVGASILPGCYRTYASNDSAGNPAVDSFSVDNRGGTMGFELQSNDDDYSSATVVLALGSFFFPHANGHLTVTSNPSYNSFWNYTYFARHVSTAAWIGMQVQQLDSAGNFQTDLRDFNNFVWNQFSSGAFGSDYGTPSGLASPLFTEFDVDTSHQYLIWVYCGGSISAAGSHGLGGNSHCNSTLSVTVPSIRWELS